MNLRSNFTLIKRKIDKEIERFNLKLNGLTLYTEAASGLFSLTPFIAAIAGAEKIYALEFESEYATIDQVRIIFKDLIKLFQLPAGKIELVSSKRYNELSKIDILTNSGGVRPIDKETIDNLKEEAVIPLMFEGWEFRSSNIDLKACKDKNILVFGTNEVYAGVFDYCGVLALKLLLESGSEILGEEILLIGNDSFLDVIEKLMKNLNMKILRVSYNVNITPQELIKRIADITKGNTIDAIIVADAISDRSIIHFDGLIDPEKLYNITKSNKLIQIAGKNDITALKKLGVVVYPDIQVDPQRMPVTLEYVGLTPLIRLQTAGLKVGEIMANYRKSYSYQECISKLLEEPIISLIPRQILDKT